MSPNKNPSRSRSRGRSGIMRALQAAVLSAMTLALPIATTAAPDDPPDPAALALRTTLTKLYPNTQFGEVHRTPIANLWEVWMGSNVAYVDQHGQHFLFGHLYDMRTQTDLTAQRQPRVVPQTEPVQARLVFKNLPLADAIRTVRGNGQRRLAVFSDPHCPYCQKLEQQLAKLDNVTIYTFLLPITSLHPEAMALAQSIWCAADRSQAWQAYMLAGRMPATGTCDAPLERNIALAQTASINGTPYLFFENGQRTAGAIDAAQIEAYLATAKE